MTNTTTPVRTTSHRKADIARALVGETMVQFNSTALDLRSEPILKKAGLDPENLPKKGKPRTADSKS